MSGFSIITVLRDTLSAPDISISSISQNRIPPPHVKGIKQFLFIFLINSIYEILLSRLLSFLK